MLTWKMGRLIWTQKNGGRKTPSFSLKAQVQAMLRVLLPGVKLAGADAADALAVAICHAHMRRD